MKLKLVVASMSILGLVSFPAFADSSKKHAKHHHHKMMKDVAEYKDAPLDAAPQVCTISHSAMIMNRMTQSEPDVTSQGLGLGRSMPSPCNPGWFNRIQVSGGINFDFGKFGSRNQNYMGENYQRFSLNDAYINVAAAVSDWAKGFASISYNTATFNPPWAAPLIGIPPLAEYSAAYSNNINSIGTVNSIQLEQAYASFGNFDVSPIFIQVGKQFQDFGRYEIHPITESITQVMSETLATSVKLGFIANGFHGSIYGFDNPLNKVNKNYPSTNYGAALGFDMPSDAFGWDLGVAYLNSMIGVNGVAYVVDQWNALAGFDGYQSNESALAAYADVNMGPFVIGARYTTALSRFNIIDLPKNGIQPSTSGAKPWGGTLQAAYGFEGWGTNQSIYLGYQLSRQAAALLLPQSRWALGYGLDVFGKNTNLGVEWDHDNNYSVSKGGAGGSSNLVTFRMAVKFG